MDSTAQALLIGALSGGFVAILTAIGVFIVNNRASRSTAKKSDIADLESSYAKLQKTYEDAFDKQTLRADGLQVALDAERTARAADKLDCQTRIGHLETQLTVLLSGPLTVKVAEISPNIEMPVAITRVDTDTLPALPVKITDVREEVVLPVELKKPIPLMMTLQEKADVAQKAADDEKSGAKADDTQQPPR